MAYPQTAAVGALPAERWHISCNGGEGVSVQSWLFDADGSDQPAELGDRSLARLSDRQLLWVDASSPNDAELRDLAAIFESV